MKKILATSILLTLFVTAQGCGHMYGSHKKDHDGAACACEKSGGACKSGNHDDAKKGEKKAAGCTDCTHKGS